jgi:hypothetical protein
MPKTFEHLTERARQALALSVQERENYMNRDHWIGYACADGILDNLEKLLQGPRVERMPCRMIYGATNNGKSRIVKKFKKAHLSYETEEGLVVPVVLIKDIGEASVRGLYNNIIDEFGFPNNPSDQPEKLEFRAYKLLVHYKTRILMLDEFNAIAQDTPVRQRRFMEKLRVLSNNLKISVVGAGTDEAFNATRQNKQFSNRFKPLPVDIWSEGDQWTAFLMAIEQLLPLPEPSYIYDDRFARLILAQSEGTLGDALTLIREMASYAMNANKNNITPDMIAQIGWVPPSEQADAAKIRVARAL